MAVGLNSVVLVGNLTRDPELRHTQSGVAVCGLRMAVNGSEKVGGEWRDRADFFDVRVWGNTGENCARYLKRGSSVGVSGKLRYEEWEDAEKGKRSKVLVEARDVQFLDSKRDREESAAFVPPGQGEEFSVPQEDFTTPAADDDDIPF